MAQAKLGDKVKIDYTGKLEDGTVFDSTIEDEISHEECDADDCGDDCTDDSCGCGGHECGPMELTIGEEKMKCASGDGYSIPGGMLHSVRVASGQPVELLEIFSPPKQENRI